MDTQNAFRFENFFGKQNATLRSRSRFEQFDCIRLHVKREIAFGGPAVSSASNAGSTYFRETARKHGRLSITGAPFFFSVSSLAIFFRFFRRNSHAERSTSKKGNGCESNRASCRRRRRRTRNRASSREPRSFDGFFSFHVSTTVSFGILSRTFFFFFFF